MSDERLFGLDEVPEVPLLPEPRARRGAAVMDARLDNDYPPEWGKCTTCDGHGKVFGEVRPDTEAIKSGDQVQFVWRHSLELISGVRHPENGVGEFVGVRLRDTPCPDCLGMGSRKARVRLEAGHRCVRCGHPYMPKGDAKMLGVEPSGVGGEHMGGRWSACDEECRHGGPYRTKMPDSTWQIPGYEDGGASEFNKWRVYDNPRDATGIQLIGKGWRVEAEWRILTVHHLDGDKANLRWWNLAALCQRCHLQIQGKVVMDRVYPHVHSEWFRLYVAGYYAFVYLCKTCGRDMTRPAGYVAGGPSPQAIPLDRVRRLDDYPHMCEPGFEISREEAVDHLDFLLGLELDPSYGTVRQQS